MKAFEKNAEISSSLKSTHNQELSFLVDGYFCAYIRMYKFYFSWFLICTSIYNWVRNDNARLQLEKAFLIVMVYSRNISAQIELKFSNLTEIFHICLAIFKTNQLVFYGFLSSSIMFIELYQRDGICFFSQKLNTCTLFRPK